MYYFLLNSNKPPILYIKDYIQEYVFLDFT